MLTSHRLIHPHGCPDDIDGVNPFDELFIIREWAALAARDCGNQTIADTVVKMVDNVLAGRQATDDGVTP